MSSRTPIPFLVLCLVGCARHTIQPLSLITPTHLGPSTYGPGIIKATRTDLDFMLDSAANVIVLRVSDWGIEPVRPRPPESGDLAAGTYRVSARSFLLPTYGAIAAPAAPSTCEYDDLTPTPTRARGEEVTDSSGRMVRSISSARRRYESCLQRERTRASIFEPTGLASIGAAAPAPDEGYWLLIVSDAETRAEDLAGLLELPDRPLESVVRSLPEKLVGSRTDHWAADYVPFAR